MVVSIIEFPPASNSSKVHHKDLFLALSPQATAVKADCTQQVVFSCSSGQKKAAPHFTERGRHDSRFRESLRVRRLAASLIESRNKSNKMI
jgi:hypothetical protein